MSFSSFVERRMVSSPQKKCTNQNLIREYPFLEITSYSILSATRLEDDFVLFHFVQTNYFFLDDPLLRKTDQVTVSVHLGENGPFFSWWFKVCSKSNGCIFTYKLGYYIPFDGLTRKEVTLSIPIYLSFLLKIDFS